MTFHNTSTARISIFCVIMILVMIVVFSAIQSIQGQILIDAIPVIINQNQSKLINFTFSVDDNQTGIMAI